MRIRIALTSIAAAATAVLAFAGVVAVGAGPAQATAAMAQQTKLGCPACHVMPPTKDKLTDRGKQFQSTGK